MKPGIPKPGPVDGAFKLLAKRFDVVVKKINREAASAMKAGDYDAAQRWMESGRLVADFSSRAAHFSTEWKRLVQAARVSEPQKAGKLPGEQAE